eukprot:4573335-Amphidinium_carterae.1
MDDFRFSSSTCRELVLQFHCPVVLRRCAGLTANMLKTVVLPLVSQSEEAWQSQYRPAVHQAAWTCLVMSWAMRLHTMRRLRANS